MEVLIVICTVPAVIALSVAVALSPIPHHIRDYIQARILTSMWWAVFIFCASAAAIFYVDINDASNYAPRTMGLAGIPITQFQAQRNAVIWEIALRTLMDDGHNWYTCRTRTEVCKLADAMYHNIPADIDPPWGEGIMMVGIITGSAAGLTLFAFSSITLKAPVSAPEAAPDAAARKPRRKRP